jgi:hypothetical protein
LVAHGLKTVADRRLPLVESLDEVITAIREALREFRDQRSERAAAFTVPVTLRFDRQVPPSSQCVYAVRLGLSRGRTVPGTASVLYAITALTRDCLSPK